MSSGVRGGTSSALGGTFGGLRRPCRSSLLLAVPPFGLRSPRSSHRSHVPFFSEAVSSPEVSQPVRVAASSGCREMGSAGAERGALCLRLARPSLSWSKGSAPWESRGCGSCWSAPGAGSARKRWRARCWPWVSFRRSGGAGRATAGGLGSWGHRSRALLGCLPVQLAAPLSSF